jgi:hypothetical protein
MEHRDRMSDRCRHSRGGLLFAAVLVLFVTFAGRAVSQTPLDAGELRHYPLREVTADFALRYIVQLGPGGREPYLQALAQADARLRTLIVLETLRRWLGVQGLHTYFFLHAGDIAPDVLAALRDAQLDHKADIMAEALEVFGPVYPVDHKVRKQLFGYNTSPDINDFDRRLMPITLRFGDRHSMADAIEAYVRRAPWLLDRMEQHRAEMPAENRLRWLQAQLSRHVDISGSVATMQAGLAALPADYRPILVLGLFQLEFGNGGVRQFFFNSAGNLAPEGLAAFEALNLTKHAAVMRKALGMFAEPYERETQTRRVKYFYFSRGTGPWGQELQRHTSEIEAIRDEPYFNAAVLEFARSRDLIPR